MRTLRSFLAVVMVFAGCASAQDPRTDPAPLALLQRVRTRLLDDAQRQQRYLCAQSITRKMYRATVAEGQSCQAITSFLSDPRFNLPLTSWDRLRLDVGIADGNEIHAWPNAERFSEDEFRMVLGDGFFGTGDFGFVIPGVFGNASSVEFQGRQVRAGRTFFNYTYRVPASASGYQVQTESTPVFVAYGGSFALDPQTEDIVELTIRTPELPKSAPACQTLSEIEYARLAIHNREVLVPRKTRLRAIYRDGQAGLNETEYSTCREYGSKAVLRFDVADASRSDHASEPQKTVKSNYPSGLAFDCRIVTPIDSDTAAAGNPIEAILRSPIRDEDGVTLAPRGAHVQGRLMRFTYHRGRPNFFEVGVRLDSVELNGGWQPVNAALAHPAEVPSLTALKKHPGDASVRPSDLPAPLPQNVGVFYLVEERLHLPEIDATWVTMPDEIPSPTRNPIHSTPSPLVAQHAAEMDVVNRFVLAVQYSQQATDLLNAKPSTQSLADYAKLAEILALRREAIETGKSADPEELNDLYPSLGDHFKNQFLAGLLLFVHGCDVHSGPESLAKGELSRSTLLYDEWGSWYAAHRQEIDDLTRSSETRGH